MKKKLVFTLQEKSKRSVTINNLGVYEIEEKFSSEEFRRKYNKFVIRDISFLRKLIGKMYGSFFTENASVGAHLLSYFFTPLPQSPSPKGRLLDVGCSDGIWLSFLPKTWEKFGVEINETACQIADKRGVSVTNVTFEKYTAREKFDYIRASHVLEHISDYNLFFTKANKLLVKGGTLLIYTPNSGSVSFQLYKRYWEGFYDKTHVKIFNTTNIVQIAKIYEFTITYSKTYYMGYTPSGIIRYLHLMDSTVMRYLFWILYIICYPIELLFAKMGKGDAMCVAFKKVG